MHTSSHRSTLLPFVLTTLLALILPLLTTSGPLARQHGPVYALQPPPITAPSGDAQVGLTSIATEAGIAAWFQAPSAITLNDVRSAFRTIEAETADYIIGSVPVTNYPETEDVHVYVNTDGWILAYYLAADPVGKIYDWRDYHDTGRTSISTKLENTLAVVADAAGALLSGASYYHFRYPNATHLMLIAEWATGATDSFQVKLPGSFVYYERSWSLANNDAWCYYLYHNYYCQAWYKVNGVQIQYHPPDGWQISQATLSVSQLPPDQYNSVEVTAELCANGCYAYGGLALVYRAP